MRIGYQRALRQIAILVCFTMLNTPLASAGQTGRAKVEINGVVAQLSGHCMTNEVAMQFWSDGNDGPAQRDLNGDGAYLDTVVHSGMRSLQGGAAVQLMSESEWIYKGIAKPASREGSTLTIEHSYTRSASKGSGHFEIKVIITCHG